MEAKLYYIAPQESCGMGGVLGRASGPPEAPPLSEPPLWGYIEAYAGGSAAARRRTNRVGAILSAEAASVHAGAAACIPSRQLSADRMHLLVDGHNLIGQMPGLSLADPDDEAQLVLLLRGYAMR